MNALTTYLADESTLLFKWQDLAGSIIGVFGAISVTFLGFLLNHIYQNNKQIRENIRRTEIALALGLNDIYDIERHLNDFLNRLDIAVIQPLRNNLNPGQYCISKTNFPFLSIYIDQSLLKGQYRSYYVHNKILGIHKVVVQANEMFKQMKEEYQNIVETGKFLIVQRASFDNQRREYLSHNESFRTFVLDVLEQLQIGKKEFARTKVYNLKLLTKKRFMIWCLEGVSFKFFLSKKEIEKYKGQLECLDRIDIEIDHEVNKLMKKAEESRS